MKYGLVNIGYVRVGPQKCARLENTTVGELPVMIDVSRVKWSINQYATFGVPRLASNIVHMKLPPVKH